MLPPPPQDEIWGAKIAFAPPAKPSHPPPNKLIKRKFMYIAMTILLQIIPAIFRVAHAWFGSQTYGCRVARSLWLCRESPVNAVVPSVTWHQVITTNNRSTTCLTCCTASYRKFENCSRRLIQETQTMSKWNANENLISEIFIFFDRNIY